MQNNKTAKIFYWITTILLALFIIPGVLFLNSEMALEGTKHMGMPMWFHWELGIAKGIGGILLILPFIPNRLKEWTYVAFGIDFISAFIAWVAVDGLKGEAMFPIVTLILLVISYVTWHKIGDRRFK